MSKHVRGHGPLPCDFLMCGEGPGFHESQQGLPFVGKTGDELDRHLNGIELPARDDCYLTNIFREYRGKDYVWTSQDLIDAEPELLQELRECQPKVIVCLGRYATRFFMGDVDLESVWGLPWEIGICYGCARNGRKVLVQSGPDWDMLELERMRQQSRIRMVDVSLQNVVGAPPSLHIHKGITSTGSVSRSSVHERTMCLSRSSGDSKSGTKQQKSKEQTTQLPVRASIHAREYVHVSEQSISSPLPNMRSAAGESTKCSICSGDIRKTIAFPIHHIAAGFHNSEMSAYVVAGFRQLGEYLAGKSEPRRLYDDPLAGKEQYEEITDPSQIQIDPTKPVSIDTEGWPENPWSLQYSQEPGRAFLIRAKSPLLQRFSDTLRRSRSVVIFHSALHDLSMMRALGIPFQGKFEDTIVQAYLLQIEPQGLKALCTRHCNMRMQSYDEITHEPGQRLAIEYLTWLWDAEQEQYEKACEDEFIRLTTTPYTNRLGKVVLGRRLKVHPKLPKTALHKAVQRCLQSKDARKLWNDQIEDIQIEGYGRLGSMPQPTLDYVPSISAIQYGCRDADGTTRVRAQLSQHIRSLGLQEVCNLELNTYPLIDRMQQIGIKPDLQHFATLSESLGIECGRLRVRLEQTTKQSSFNANSGDQVAAYLFDELNLEGIKRTSSGRYSTNDKILEALEKEHGTEYPVISDIRAYRETYKLKHTFVDRLPDFVQRWPFDGRIHATFRTTRVVTGRLAAADPNLLAMPKHGKFANDFRRGWVPEDGHILCEWDLSQIELRVLAHLSQDPVLLAAFRTGRDLHAGLAQRIFGGYEDDHKKGPTRLAAKAVNFGIPMGMTAVGLSVELRKNGVDADEDDAQKWLDETMALYTQVSIYQDQKAAEAARNGFVRCLSGRIRYIGGIRSKEARIREEAKRFAFSTPIQEGAQYVAKTAEVWIWNNALLPLWKRGHYIEPLIQIHDALTFETDLDTLDEADKLIVYGLTQAPKDILCVPIETSGEWGFNWADMHEINA